MRSVTLMFDRLITWFTPERRVRLYAAAEVLLAVWLTTAILLNGRWSDGPIVGAITASFALLLGAGVALHRVRPGVAQIGTAGLIFYVLFAVVDGWTPPTWAIVAACVIQFGGVAYGREPVRWFAFAVTIIMSVSLAISIVSAGYYFVGTRVENINALATQLLASIAALLPWILGELVRSILKRRALSAAVETVSTERDAALTRADLEAERTRVARDVHDIVAHSLTVVIAQADGARYATTADSPAAADAFGTIAQTARDALADVRTLLTELRHTQEAGPQPGIQNLDALVDSFRDSGLTLTVHEFGDRGGLTDARELALYRILQESLTNALRHGDGAATLDLDWGDATVDLLVTNVAAAPAPASADAAVTVVTHGDHQPERGHGIDGMRERAILAGGEFSIREGATFRVRARLPREPREPSQPEAAIPDTIDTEVLA